MWRHVLGGLVSGVATMREDEAATLGHQAVEGASSRRAYIFKQTELQGMKWPINTALYDCHKQS